MKTCHYCNTTFKGNTRFHYKPCCLNCRPMMRKAYYDADRSRWYAENGIDQIALREAYRASGGFIPYKGATYNIGNEIKWKL